MDEVSSVVRTRIVVPCGERRILLERFLRLASLLLLRLETLKQCYRCLCRERIHKRLVPVHLRPIFQCPDRQHDLPGGRTRRCRVGLRAKKK